LELLFITIREKLSDADKRIQEGFQAIADRKL